MDQWNTWGAKADGPPNVFFDGHPVPQQAFTNVTTTFDPRTRYAMKAAASSRTVVASSGFPMSRHYQAKITRSSLLNAIGDLNPLIRA